MGAWHEKERSKDKSQLQTAGLKRKQYKQKWNRDKERAARSGMDTVDG